VELLLQGQLARGQYDAPGQAGSLGKIRASSRPTIMRMISSRVRLRGLSVLSICRRGHGNLVRDLEQLVHFVGDVEIPSPRLQLANDREQVLRVPLGQGRGRSSMMSSSDSYERRFAISTI